LVVVAVRLAKFFLFTAAFALLAVAGDDASQTERWLQEQARLHPESFQANHLLGEFLVQQYRLAAAIVPLEQAERIQPNHYANSYDLASAYLLTGLSGKSRQQIAKLLKQEDKAELHNLLADVEAAEGNTQEAAQQYEVAARMDGSEKNLFDLGSYLSLHRGFEPAIEVFRFGTQRYPQSAKLRVGMGVAFYFLGQYDKAVESLCQAADLDPADARALEFLGKMYDISGQYAAEVTKRLAHFVQSHPLNANANYYYALSLRKRIFSAESTSRSGDVEKYLLTAVALNPGWAEPHFELGLLYEDAAQNVKAIQEFEAAIGLRPGFAKAHYHLARSYQQDHREKLAQKEFEVFKTLKSVNEEISRQ